MDLTINAPAAARAMPTAKPEGASHAEHAQMLAADNARLRAELDQLHMTTGTIANVALSMLHLLRNEGENAVKIPRAVSDRMREAKIHISEAPDGDVLVALQERDQAIVVVEGRPLV